jgi:phage-related minor tail protein
MAAEFKINAQELIAKVEELIKEGNARRIIIKDDKGKTYIEIPVTVGVIGALFAPIVAAVGALAGLAANFTIEVIKKDDEDKS